MQVFHHVLGGKDVGDAKGRCGGRSALFRCCAPHQDGSVHMEGLATYEDLVRGRVTGKREELDECRFGEAIELRGVGEPEGSGNLPK